MQLLRVRCVLISTALACTVQAQVITRPLSSEPGLNWRVGTEFAYDDNVFRTASATDSEAFWGLQPEAAWYGYAGPNEFDLTFKGDFRRYQESDVLDFNAWRIAGNARLDHTVRLNTAYNLALEAGVEKPGETDQLFLPGRGPNEFDRWNGIWRATYGAEEATGQLRARVGYEERRFNNNDQEFRNADTTSFTGTFLYRVAPRTRLLLEFDYNDFDFLEQDAFGSDQSGVQSQYLAGITWEARGNTSGEFRIGFRDRSFDDERFFDLSGLALALSMTWRPSELTKVELTAEENNKSSAVEGAGGFVRTGVGASLTRSTGARSRLVADIAYGNLEFSSSIGREDDRLQLGAGFEYDLTSRLSARMEYRFDDRNSSFEPFEFNANVLLFSFTFSPPR